MSDTKRTNLLKLVARHATLRNRRLRRYRRRRHSVELLEPRQMLAAAVWHNVLDAANVDGDSAGIVSPVDALTVIEELIRPQFQDPQSGLLPKQVPDGVTPPYLDVSCDGIVSPRDELIVVERLVHGGSGQSHSGGGMFSSVACSPQLLEGTGFRSQLSQQLILPDDSSGVEVSFRAPQFDTQSRGTMQDALEIEITDANGQPLSLPYSSGHDAVVNWSEANGMATGPGTTITPGGADEDWKATVNLNGLPQGSDVHANLRLVNNDTDDNTSVIVRGFQVVDAPTAPPAGIQFSAQAPLSSSPLVMDELTDLSSSFPASYGRSTLDGNNDEFGSELTVTNRSNFTVMGRLIVALGNISNPATHVMDADGFLPDGRPFIDLSAQIPSGQLEPGDSVSSRRLTFLNDSDERFSYELSTYGKLNRAPSAFDTNPIGDIEAGKDFRYTAHADDADGDPLVYSVEVGPGNAFIDPQTGELQWPTTTGDVGNHQFTLRATDPHGLFVEQTLTLEVVESLQNRPPVFVSTPVTEAIAASGFEVSTVATGNSPSGIALANVGIARNSLVTINPGSQTLSQITAQPRDNYAPPVDVSIGEPAPSGDLLRSGYNIDIGFPPYVHPGQDFNRIDGFDQGDIDGDGILDLVSNRFAYESVPRIRHQDIVVSHGDGNGGFARRDEWPIPLPASISSSDYTTLAVADFNNDGWDDVLTVNTKSNQLVFLANDTTGGLSAPQLLDLTTPIFDFKLVDINQDDKLDLLTIPESNDSVGYMLGNGDGTFTGFQAVFTESVYFYAFGNYHGRPYDAGDLDGDGDLDIAVIVNGGSPRYAAILINDGNLSFTDAAHVDVFSPVNHWRGAIGTMLQIADFNGDNNGDVLIGTHQGVARPGGAILYTGDGSGTSFALVDAAPVTTFAPANLAGKSDPIDLDGDGDLDVVVGSGYYRQQGYEPSVLLNNGDGTFVSHGLTTPSFDIRGGGTTDTDAVARGVTVGDYNRDGVLDLAVSRSNRGLSHDYSSVSIVLADRPGQFATGRTTTIRRPVNTENNFFLSGDFNNDGYLDIWSPGSQSVSRTWFGDGSGTYSDDRSVIATPYIGNETLDMGFAEDLDHDGKLDVVWLGNNGIQGGPAPRVLVAIGNGDGTFSITFAGSGAGTLGIIRPADFNEDGYIDFATRSHGPEVDVWLYDPANRGTFVRTQTFPLKGVGINVN